MTIRVGLVHTRRIATDRVAEILSHSDTLQCVWAIPSGIPPIELIRKPLDLIVVHHSNDIAQLVYNLDDIFDGGIKPRIAVTASRQLESEEMKRLAKLGATSFLELPQKPIEEAEFLEALMATVYGLEHRKLKRFSSPRTSGQPLLIINRRIFPLNRFSGASSPAKWNMINPVDFIPVANRQASSHYVVMM